jgi:hypothetical protein
MDDPKLEPACESLGYEIEGDKFERVLWNTGEAVSLIEEGN